MRQFSKVLCWMLIVIMVGPFGLNASHTYAEPGSTPPPEADGWVQISTAQQLMYINENQVEYLDKDMMLMNAVDLSGNAWTPLGGNSFEPYTGIFDGNGYIISGITIDEDALENVGFFGESSGTIRNVGVSVQVVGGASTGGLVGYQHNGSIERSYSLGSVEGGGEGLDYNAVSTGGLIGLADQASIQYTYSSASVTSGVGNNIYVGGLAGHVASHMLADSYATGTVTNKIGNNHYLHSAGLVGFIYNANIARTYAVGDVDITKTTNATGTEFGGLMASTFGTNSVDNSYFDRQTTGQSTDASGATGHLTADMKVPSTYNGFNFAEDWHIDSAVNDGYPYLRPAVVSTALPYATKETLYSYQLSGFDGLGSGLTWSSSPLPDGMSLSTSGELQGVPEQAGTSSITFTATDAGGASVDRTISLTVNELAPALTDFHIEPGNVLTATQVTAVAGHAGNTFAYTLTGSASAQPILGEIVPNEATVYTLGEDIQGVSIGQYLNMYEINTMDMIQAWNSVQLDEAYIRMIISVTGVSLDTTEATLVEGQAPLKLTATVEPADATNQTVAWSSNRPEVATVNASGEVTPVSEGTALITVTTADGSHTASATITVELPPPTTGTVTGIVYGGGDVPLPGATVSLNGTSSTTDSEGSFALLHVEEGSHMLTITASDYETKQMSVHVAAGVVTNIGRITLTANVLPVTGTVTGVVYGRSNVPLSGASVVWNDRSTTTDSQGRFSLTDIDEGNQTITFSASRYRSTSITAEVIAGTTIDAGSIQLTAVRSGGQSSGSGSGATTDSELGIRINGEDEVVTVIHEEDSDGRTTIRLQLNAEMVSAMFADTPITVIEVNNTDPIVKIEVPADAIHEVYQNEPDAAMHVRINGASYLVPLQLWEDVPGSAILTVAIAIASDTVRSSLDSAGSELGYRLLTTPVDFTIYADDQELVSFGNLYTERTLTLDSPVDTDTSTVVWIDKDNYLHFIPSVFTNKNNSVMATFYAPHNSMYAVVQTMQHFTDIEGHWAQADIELLAHKLILSGIESHSFAPNEHITRAEFAALIVRSLGLADSSMAASFKDVPTTAWYAGALVTAVEAGVISGYEDYTFRPHEPVTREQMAAILTRAMSFAGSELPEASLASLQRFTDRTSVAAWAAEPTSQLLEAGIIQGMSDTSFAPKAYASRAQSAVMLREMLQYMKFIN